MDYPAAPQSTASAPCVAVLAAVVHPRAARPADAVCRAISQCLELAGVPPADLRRLRVGVFAAADPLRWEGHEHIAVCDTFGFSGTTAMVSQGRCGPGVALHLAATAVRAADVDLAMVIGPVRPDVGAVVLAHEGLAATNGWHIRSRILASAVGALGQGRPPVEIATHRAGVEPARQRYGLTLADVAGTTRTHQNGQGPVTGHGVSGSTVAVHLVMSPPHPAPANLPWVPFLGLAAPTVHALERLVRTTLERLETPGDLAGMAADATTRASGSARLAVPVTDGVDAVRAHLERWLEGESTVPDSTMPPATLVPVTAANWPMAPPAPAALAWLWAQGLIRWPRTVAPLSGRNELPPTPGAQTGPNVPRAASGVQPWRVDWASWHPGPPQSAPIHVLCADAQRAVPLVTALTEAGQAASWRPSVAPFPSGTLVHLPSHWAEVLDVAAAVDRQRTPARLVVIGRDPATIGAARWVAADLPHLFGGCIQAEGHEPDIADIVPAIAGAELRLTDAGILRRHVGIHEAPPPARLAEGTWILGGHLDPPMLDLAAELADHDSGPLLLCAWTSPEPMVLHRALQLRRRGAPCNVVRPSDLHVPDTIAGVVVRIAEPFLHHGHLRAGHDPNTLERVLKHASWFSKVAGDAPLWLWAEGRSPAPVAGTGIRAVTGACLDAWAANRGGPTTVLHTDIPDAAGWVRLLGPLGGVHGAWPSD